MTETPEDLFMQAQQAREQVLNIIYQTGSSHIGSAFSVIDILVAMYHDIVDVGKIRRQAVDRDYVILSKGHAAAALYAALESVGIIDAALLQSYCRNGSHLLGHPVRNTACGIEVSSGSLGHGLPIAAGLGLVSKQRRYENSILVVMSDGELNEGSVWEALNTISHWELTNVISIVDCNAWQAYDRTADITDTSSYARRFQAFGYHVIDINGHNFVEICDALGDPQHRVEKPLIILAHTVKGKGVSFMEDRLEWHYKSPNENQYRQALEELQHAQYIY